MQQKIIPDVEALESAEQSSEEAVKIMGKINKLREALMKSLRNFNTLMVSSVLPENRSIAKKEEENTIIAEMTNTALEIDKYCHGEGTLALAIFAIRQAIGFRDAGNKLAYEIERMKEENQQLKERVARIENGTPVGKIQAKQTLMAKAEELGIKISIED